VKIVSDNIAGKVVVITGASAGLGEATARLLSAQGASVALGARREGRIRSLADELTGSGGKALAVVTDVTGRDQVQKLVDAAVQTYGRIDVMINNAGLMPQAPLERLKVDEWDRMIDVNIKGVLYGIAAALPHMMRQKAGHFVNVSSVAGHRVGPGFAVYAATKHAVRALSEGLRQEVKPYNIRTTVISPGAVATELAKRDRPGLGRENPHVLCEDRNSCRFVRAGGRLRDQPAGGGGRERDPVPAHAPGAVGSLWF
jgi:NADP-dependent 3-hydroxy acid dehydrogenase YdfG